MLELEIGGPCDTPFVRAVARAVVVPLLLPLAGPEGASVTPWSGPEAF